LIKLMSISRRGEPTHAGIQCASASRSHGKDSGKGKAEDVKYQHCHQGASEEVSHDRLNAARQGLHPCAAQPCQRTHHRAKKNAGRCKGHGG
jgi:hypothetical protein